MGDGNNLRFDTTAGELERKPYFELQPAGNVLSAFEKGELKSYFYFISIDNQEQFIRVFKDNKTGAVCEELFTSNASQAHLDKIQHILSQIASPAIAFDVSGKIICFNSFSSDLHSLNTLFGNFKASGEEFLSVLLHALNGGVASLSVPGDEKSFGIKIYPEFIRTQNEIFFVLQASEYLVHFSEQRVPDKLLAIARKNFRLFFNHLEEGILICKGSDEIVYMNGAALRLISSLNTEHSDKENILKLSKLPVSIAAPVYRLIKNAQAHSALASSSEVWIENQVSDKRKFLIFRYIGVHEAEANEGHFFIVIQDHTEIKKLVSDQIKLKEFYEQILDELPADVAVFDKSHKYLYVNRLGISDDELRKWIIGKTDFDYCAYRKIDPHLAEERASVFNKALLEKKSQSLISKHKKNNQDEFIFRKFYPVVKNTEVEFVIGYGTNVTDLQQANLDLTIQEARFKQLFDSSPAIILIIDAQYKIVEVNRALRNLFNHLQSNFLNQSIESLFPEGNFNKIKSVILSMNSGELASNSFLCPLELPSGKYFFEMMISSIPAAGQNHAVIIGIDVTRRQEMEIKFSNSQKQLNTLLDTIETVPYETRINTWHEFIYIHSNIKSLLGFNPNEIINQNDFWKNQIHPDDRPYFMDVINTLEDIKSARIEYRIKDSKGAYRWIRDHIKATVNQYGVLESISGLLEDVSDQHQLQAEVDGLQRCQFGILRLVQQKYKDINEICDEIVAKIKEELNLKLVQIWDYQSDKSGFSLFSTSGTNQNIVQEFIPEDVFRKAELNEKLHFISPDSLENIEAESLIALVRRDGKLKGFVSMTGHKGQTHWSYPYIQFIQSVADQISLMAESYFRRSAQFKLETALEYGDIMVAEIDHFQDKITWSDSGLSYFGSEGWKIIPTCRSDFETLIHPDDLQEFKTVYKLLIDTASPVAGIYRLIDGNGVLHYVDFKIKPVSDTRSSAKKFIGILQDVTQKVFAEQELNRVNESTNMLNSLIASLRSEKSERSIREIFSEQIIFKISIADCFFLTQNAQGDYEKIDKWVSAKGKTSEIANEIIESTRALMDEAWSTGEPVMEYIFLKAAGNKKTQFIIIPFGIGSRPEHLIIAYCTAYEQASETRAEFMMRGVDVLRTRMKEIRRENELIKLNNDLKVSNEQLQQYSYIISHNLRAPVSNLHGIVNLIQPDSIQGERNKLLYNKMGETVQVIDQILKDMNDLLHLKDSVEFKLSLNRLSEVYAMAKSSLDGEIQAKEALFTEDFGDDPGVLSYKPYLVSIFQNLIANALKFREHSRKLQVSILLSMPESNTVLLQFKDNGRGIDLVRNKERIFRLYSRFHRDVKGSGIGLYLVNEQMKAQRGRIEIESEPGKGTEFKLYFNLLKNK